MNKNMETWEKYDRVYRAASGLCHGCDWNKGTHAIAYRNELIDAVNDIEELPALPVINPQQEKP